MWFRVGGRRDDLAATSSFWAWVEELLGKCRSLLHDISLQSNSTYQWRWRYDHCGGYSVKGAYKLLTSQESYSVAAASYLIWHKQVPLKISILA